MPLAAWLAAQRNPKHHDIPGIQESLRRFGFVELPVINETTGNAVAGHGRVEALEAMKAAGEPAPARVRVEGGQWLIPVLRGIAFANDSEAEAYLLASNRLGESGGWDRLGVAKILADFKAASVPFEGIGYNSREVERLISLSTARTEPIEPAIPARPPTSRVKVGQVWHLGEHVLVCGDCRDPAIWKRAGVAPDSAKLGTVDPPYGMDKAFENDGLKNQALDTFQTEWFATLRPLLEPSASLLVWGNPLDLWRWWFGELRHWVDTHGAGPLTFGNEIVWDKEFGSGQGTAGIRSFPAFSERALFFQLGKQGFGNKNLDRYWPGWDPLRLYLKGEFEAAGINAKQAKAITGTSMFGHWIGVSQWQMISQEHYEKMHDASGGAQFCKAYGVIKKQHETLLSQFNEWLEKERAFFDATHDTSLSDVWRFPRVEGPERFGHATPKPVAMMVRALRSACPAGGLVLSPFGGTGSDLLACEQTDRRCVMVELDPLWCEVIIQRFESLGGKKAKQARTKGAA